MSLWMAYALNVVAIVLVYHGLFRLLQLLYRRNPLWAVSLVVLMSPFAYVLFQVGSALELMWVLLLTPFYGIAILMLTFTNWMIRYYSVAFVVLTVLSHWIHRRSEQPTAVENHMGYQAFWQRKGMALGYSATGKTTFGRLGGWVWQGFLQGVRRYWRNILVIVLVAAAMTTFLSGVELRARDPSYQEVLQFVESDRTELNRYSEGSYACARFAADFRKHALESGVRCGYVLVFFPDGRTHALNAFNTTDSGLIFIEPQADIVIALSIGQPYWDRARFSAPSYDDTVTGYTIDW